MGQRSRNFRKRQEEGIESQETRGLTREDGKSADLEQLGE